jgi:hypothetical protein
MQCWALFYGTEAVCRCHHPGNLGASTHTKVFSYIDVVSEVEALPLIGMLHLKEFQEQIY